MLKELISKITSLRKPSPADIVAPLIKMDELLKIEPSLSSEFPMSYEQYRKALENEYQMDMAGEIANTPAIGELTIEQHARKLVRVYYENRKSDEWYATIFEESKNASTRAFRAYGN